MRKTVAVAGAIATIAALPGAAFGQATYNLQSTSGTPTNLTGGGIGAVQTILLVHNTGDESGCVGSACSGYGSDAESQSTLQAISSSTGYTGSNFAAFVNVNQTGDATNITLNSFTTYFYGADQSTLLFTAIATGTPRSITDIDQGQGGYGYPYQLDQAGQTALTAALLNGQTVWVGAGASFSSANDGAESISIAPLTGTPSTVPEPSSMALLGTGLFGLVPMIRRKVRK